MPSASPLEPERVPLPRWIVPVLTLTAAGLLLWTLWLTYSLPSRHVTQHYDLAWVGFDIALLAAFVVTTWCVVRSSQWLVPAAAATGTMLLCDAWFDVITSEPGGRLEALLEAGLAELPLAILCWFIVYDVERFRQATIVRYSATARKMLGSES
jgi:predicted branched-subunit amino acid permease